ncbi:uncharacterized protein si:dkey-250k15.4 [Anoplopoma fimbria]|uniref:uncharacterized protein si:dkey-250k15.4 n=1 Tax=Anoplopoma fimbria TaxID=229290 RepID=UPI0023ED7345|nr:uncharacterized protein si:dkey-250k15.4 [Anoplopoma fimbria]XP_054476962.1 uncharacterized protein si:dkey-250k15.4 [Anoplopoma fimbria]XP_054476963.1 uncharacterized protein si:dkey-250k15.4 [Anoplopoma fimbria]XP_054476964.1 uncharacterized protein si:dkey-250k15.4 [Anoplopoma fimbria]XP_054476965.1 uncharacterized protein si:dkey-250k15.4 [Anoplopoma fimbria]
MSHECARAVSDKEKILNVFNKQSQTTDKRLCSRNRLTTDCKCLNLYSKTDGQNKMKRLRSRKERSHMRAGGKEASKSKAHNHHHCRPQRSKDMAYFQNCCHSSCPCASRRNAPFPNVISASQEPSIITDSRLIGHHGLFNHEVKSIDIERLLSEQRKLGKSEQQGQENNNSTSHPSSTSHMPSPFFTNDLLGAGTNEVLPFEKKSAHDDCRKKEEKFSQGLDITSGQRPQQQLDHSSESFKSISSSKQSSFDVVITKSRKTNPLMSEKGRESLLTPTVVKENVKTLNRKAKVHTISPVEHTPKNQESPVHQTQAHILSPSPVQLSSSHTADSFDTEHRRQDARCASKSVSAVAASLCDCLLFPLLKRRNLVAESREVLLKALRERHGPRLQENLLEMQRGLSFGVDPTEKVQNQVPTMMEELLPQGATAFQADAASQPCFDTQKTTSFKMVGSRPFNWKSRPQPHQHLEQTAEWLTSPVETSVSLLDDLLRPTYPPQFCMDFEPSGGTTRYHLFSPTICWGENASVSQHWEDSFSKPKNNKAVMFDSFENSFINHKRAVPERSSGSQYSSGNFQPFFPYQTQLPDRCSADPMHFPREKDPFETDTYSFAPSFSAHIHNPLQSFQPLSQFSHPSTCPPLRSHHADMIHYPPSHTLERDPAAPLSSFPSPEHWSFPPMRLY